MDLLWKQTYSATQKRDHSAHGGVLKEASTMNNKPTVKQNRTDLQYQTFIALENKIAKIRLKEMYAFFHVKLRKCEIMK